MESNNEVLIEIELANWRDCLTKQLITTNARWLSTNSQEPVFGNFIIPKRDFLPKPSSSFHGCWIAEIPYQMILRFTNINDLVWSQFGGSGIDYQVCNLLKRRCIINDIYPQEEYILGASSTSLQLEEKADLILSHPPYWDIIRFGDSELDGSSKKTLKDFLLWWEDIVINTVKNIKENGYFVFACSNIYKNSEEIELGSFLLLITLKHNFILKQHIIKDFGETKGSSGKDYNVNYYRQLKGRYGNFYGDNIYILQYRKSKNSIIDTLKEIL